VLPLLIAVLAALALVALFFGDWSGGGTGAAERQRVLRRWVLIIAAVLALAFLLLAFLGGFATI